MQDPYDWIELINNDPHGSTMIPSHSSGSTKIPSNIGGSTVIPPHMDPHGFTMIHSHIGGSTVTACSIPDVGGVGVGVLAHAWPNIVPWSHASEPG